MKITVTFKTPDAVDYALEDYGLPHEEAEVAKQKMAKFIKWDELIDIEFDIEKGTATVLEQ